ncbi:MAG: hypothetical protein OXN27_08335 [Candidatus Poribacteria bacterium]|nr:hypothetical protein [Candidatus Poribacteria bacterium]
MRTLTAAGEDCILVLSQYLAMRTLTAAGEDCILALSQYLMSCRFYYNIEFW